MSVKCVSFKSIGSYSGSYSAAHKLLTWNIGKVSTSPSAPSSSSSLASTSLESTTSSAVNQNKITLEALVEIDLPRAADSTQDPLLPAGVSGACSLSSSTLPMFIKGKFRGEAYTGGGEAPLQQQHSLLLSGMLLQVTQVTGRGCVESSSLAPTVVEERYIRKEKEDGTSSTTCSSCYSVTSEVKFEHKIL